MNDTDLQNDIESGELLDAAQQEQSLDLGDFQGSLEAILQVEEEEKVPLKPHQQARVDDFRTMQKAHPGKVLAVADQKALEAYVDNNGNLQMDGDAPFIPVKPLDASVSAAKKGDDPAALARLGPNVFGSIEVHGIIVPGNEGLLDITNNIFRKVTTAFSKEVPTHFKVTAKALNHYAEMAEKLRLRLVQLRPHLEKRKFPLVDIFDYGAYSRFFQVAGKPITGFSDFEEAVELQTRALHYTVKAAEGYTLVITEKLLEALQALQARQEPDVEKLVDLRESIERHWLQTWKEADLTPQHGQTPQCALNAYPQRKFVSLAPLLDNRYLLAHAPKSDGGKDPVKITEAIKHYGASLVFDKGASKATGEGSMNIPNPDDLLKLVDTVVNALADMKGFTFLAKKNDGFAKDFQKAMDVLSKQMQSITDASYRGFVAQYFKIAGAVINTSQEPYSSMAWMYVRSAMVVTTLVELSIFEEQKDRVVANRFFAKQNTEFSNPALESYELTKKALQAAQRASA